MRFPGRTSGFSCRAAALWHGGRAGEILILGGRTGRASISEAEQGRRYLIARGLPDRMAAPAVPRGSEPYRPQPLPALGPVRLPANEQRRITPGIRLALHVAARLRQRQRMPARRRFGNEVADFWISWAAGCPVVDSQSGFRLYPAALIRDLRLAPGRGRSFVFESEIIIAAARRGMPPLMVPIAALYPEGARPSHYRPWRDTLAIIAMVAGKLLARGMSPAGLIRARRRPPDILGAG